MTNRINWPNGACAALTITFDDGYADTYRETSAWLADQGLGATYYVISRRVGTGFEGHLTATWDNWQRAAQLGHEIASHSATHASMAGLFSDLRQTFFGLLTTPDRLALIRQILLRTNAIRKFQPEVSNTKDQIDPLQEPAVSRREIKDHLPECPVASFSYPAGRINRAARKAVEKAGYQSARGNQVGINLVVESPYNLCNVCVGPGLLFHELEVWLRQAIERGGWLIVTYHLVSDCNPKQYPYHLPVQDFQRMVNRMIGLPFWIAPQHSVIEYCEMNSLN